MEKISLFLLPTVRFSRPTRFCSIYYYIHPIRHLLTYSLTYRYLLTCAIVCVLVCLFVWLFFVVFEAIWAGFAILSCVSKSVCLSYRELEMLWSVNFRSSMTHYHLILRSLIRGIREKTEPNLAANISIHIVTHVVTCQRMILNAFYQAGLMRF